MAGKLIVNSRKLLHPKRAVFFLCDMQEKFAPLIDSWDGVCENARRLCEGSRLLDIPLIVSEQYPKGLGRTVPQLPIQSAFYKFEKTKFSMLDETLKQKLNELFAKTNEKNVGEANERPTVVLFGIEAQVCIMQTALSLLDDGIPVHVVADAVSSRVPTDRKLAYARMQNSGVILSSTEMVLFELMRTKDHPRFREIQALVKTVAPNCNLLNTL